jgi:hypothetical protein
MLALRHPPSICRYELRIGALFAPLMNRKKKLVGECVDDEGLEFGCRGRSGAASRVLFVRAKHAILCRNRTIRTKSSNESASSLTAGENVSEQSSMNNEQ